MKKTVYFLGSLAMLALASCSKDNDPGTTPPPNVTNVDVRGSITKDTKWSAGVTYRLRGYVYVDNNATLTIEPGTKIVSNKDSAGVLIVYKGAKINAAGTADKPIVFTSAEASPKPGDFGGVIVVGNAVGNGNHEAIEGGVDAAHKAFGGTNDADNSGVLQYVRIEYAGKAVNPGDEVNGLSMYTVGSGTTVDHIQIVRGLDDAFEFFGGSFNAKYLVAYNCADDDFDLDDGYHGKIQFGVSIKDPAFNDDKGTSGDISNNFEVDNTTTAKGYLLTPITNPTMSNFTAIGPNNATGTVSTYGYNMRWRRGAKFTLANSIVMGGQRAGLDIDNDPTAQYYVNGLSGFKNSLLQSYGDNYKVDALATASILTAAGLKTLVEGRDGSKVFATAAEVGLNDPFNNAAPNLAPKAGSAAATATAAFTATALNDAFFTKTTYVGAVDPAGTDWTKASWLVYGK
ncbi:hypothetical protein LX99_03643 [Mucilaginibacter oryzae]|uniref:T9SS C-terminal target domain-containing protein n=1 Tax=Mucilaginibacter oryzae TaxID=468058 RepID=A0A316H7C1_9SPHI|nr:hypothetical protein [Mucilaginibacter oryzae]PWK75910.1 hypothetical protein LX99_03643 [Mucilaginibacter oryzae]